jgi:peptidoglycan/LPS O-acetylase OafA/YrhL
MSRKHFMALDGLRGVAATSVVVFHGRWLSPSGHAFDHGLMAVGFFFMLSGCVIDHAYTDRLRSSLSFLKFAQLRVFRLYPMIVIGAISGLAVAGGVAFKSHNYPLVLSLLLSAPFAFLCLPAPSVIASQPFIINQPTWSLFFEIVANAAYAVFLVRLGKRMFIFLSVIAACVSLLMAFKINTLNAGYQFGELQWGIGAVFAPFMIGMLLNRYRFFRRGWRFPFWVLSLLLIATFQMPALDRPWDGLYQFSCMVLIYPFLIAVAQDSEPSGRWVTLAKASAYVSYPLYALHYPLVTFFEHLAGHFNLPKLPSLVVMVILCVAVSALISRVVEEPVREWLRLKFTARAPLGRDKHLQRDSA